MAMVTGPAGPNPQYRLASGRLKSDELILINKNVYFEEGKPVKNRFEPVQFSSLKFFFGSHAFGCFSSIEIFTRLRPF